MPNIVGIGKEQVPTNAMLGGLAYQDNITIENIDAIKAKTVDTAVDVFVYDTRKDSDGGAWRKRTSHTSWYNEKVSATRGARKEFPAVAVIVATTDTYTIYDGDDPNMSMWMVFESDGSSGARIARSGTSAITMLNGLMCAVRSGSQRAAGFASFIDDTGYQINNSAKYLQIGGWDGLVNRNVTGSFSGTDSSYATAGNGTYYDVAMAVLPNARVDDATGLPIPTIVIGNNGNTSIIRDNGTVADLEGFNPVAFVAIDGNSVVCATSGATSGHDFIFKTNIPSQDEAFQSQIISASKKNFYMNSNTGTTPLLRDLNATAMSYNPSDGTVYRGGDKGFDIITKTRTLSGTSSIPLISYIDTDYNSGYMVGDIKSAWLADTDDTNISADSLQDNSNSTLDSTFATSNGWTANTDWTISGGVATCDGQNNGRWIYPSNSSMFSVGTIVAVEVTVTARTSGTLSISYGTGAATSGTSMTGTGTFYFVGKVDGNGLVYLRSDSFIGSVDNVKMYIAEADRSINNKGLAVVGTVTKSAVATGAELVRYSGFSAGNYLTYNAGSMNFGTGDFSVSVWVIPSTDTTNEFILELDDASQGSNRFYLLVTNTATKKLYVPWDSDVSGSELTAGAWNHIVVGRSSGVGYVYVNGISISDGTDAWTTSLNGNGRGAIGNYSATPNTQYAWSGSLALLRISGSMPTAEQVKKIYNDEKKLFTTNAKCTLAGATSAITAMAYDDSTDILHVGTSSGRSDFVGLNRINNTTTAVTTAISASNGLVAEQ